MKRHVYLVLIKEENSQRNHLIVKFIKMLTSNINNPREDVSV